MALKEIQYILKYIHSNIILSIAFLYIIISIILKSTSVIDITIPCLWTTIFGMKCPGCGLTTASVELTHFRFKEAFGINPLVYIVVPAFAYYIISDYLKFRKKHTNQNQSEIQNL